MFTLDTSCSTEQEIHNLFELIWFNSNLYLFTIYLIIALYSLCCCWHVCYYSERLYLTDMDNDRHIYSSPERQRTYSDPRDHSPDYLMSSDRYCYIPRLTNIHIITRKAVFLLSLKSVSCPIPNPKGQFQGSRWVLKFCCQILQAKY